MFWLKEYAESHRKRPGSSAARRLDKRLLVKQRQNARRKSSAAATEDSTEDILQSLASNSEQGEHRRSPPGSAFSLSRESRIFRSRRRKAFHMRAFSLLPANSHRCRRPGIRQGASKEEKQFQPGQKRTLPSPASAETGRNKKKNCTGKPIVGKARRGKAGGVELKGEAGQIGRAHV